MKCRTFRQVLPMLTLVGSLFALAPLVHAQPAAGIDFDTGSTTIILSSTNGAPPDVLKSVTATCRTNGFLWATATAAFEADTVGATAKKASVVYSLEKGTAAIDPTTINILEFFVPLSPSGSAGFASAVGSTMRVDSCTAGQTVTYNFTARRQGLTAADKVQANRPKLVVTFFEQRI